MSVDGFNVEHRVTGVSEVLKFATNCQILLILIITVTQSHTRQGGLWNCASLINYPPYFCDPGPIPLSGASEFV